MEMKMKEVKRTNNERGLMELVLEFRHDIPPYEWEGSLHTSLKCPICAELIFILIVGSLEREIQKSSLEIYSCAAS